MGLFSEVVVSVVLWGPITFLFFFILLNFVLAIVRWVTQMAEASCGAVFEQNLPWPMAPTVSTPGWTHSQPQHSLGHIWPLP